MNIKEALDNNNLTLFVGSGVSIDSGIPSWPGLMAEIKKALNTKDKDFLKLAELFYLSFKNNRYYSLLEERIPNSSKPNILHKEIVKLNAKNIITTNWDELLEKAALDEGEFVDVVHSDEDIGYATGFKKIIKMHGTLTKRNIVFKETDYLNYNQNFPLIENYIKSIFSTDCVLMVGYSLSDINLQQVISWVNHHSKHIKPIYLLKPCSEFDSLEYEYYKSKNIFILYWIDRKTVDSKQCKLSNATENFLECIGKESNLTLSATKSFKDRLLLLVEKLNNKQLLLPGNLLFEIKKEFNLYGVNEIFITLGSLHISSSEIIEAVQSISKSEDAKLLSVLLKKLDIYSIKDGDQKIIFNSIFDEVDLDEKLAKLNKIDFTSLSLSINNYVYLPTKTLADKLQLAFNLYKLRKFEEAFLLLSNIAKEAFSKRELEVWFLALFNKKQFYIHLLNESTKRDSFEHDKLKKYNQEIQSIDLIDELLRLPKKHRVSLQPLLSLENYLESKLLTVVRLNKKIEQSYKIKQQGGMTFNNDAYNLVSLCYEVQKTVEDNKLTLIYDHNYRELLDAAFKSICAYLVSEKRLELSIGLFLLGVRNNLKQDNLLAYFDAYIGENRFNLIDEDGLFCNSLLELEKELLAKDFFDGQAILDYFHNFISISSFLDLDDKKIKCILSTSSVLLEKNKYMFNTFKYLNYFINLHYEYNCKALSQCKNELSDYVKLFIDKFLLGNFTGHELQGFRHTNLFRGLIYCLSQFETDYEFSDKCLLERYLGLLENSSFGIVSDNSLIFLIPLYSISSEDIKQKISSFYEAIIEKDAAVRDEVGKLTLLYYLAKSELNISIDNKLMELLDSVKGSLVANTLESIKAEPIINAVNTYLEEQAINPSPDDKE